MGCTGSSSQRERAARKWRRCHTQHDWIDVIVDDWAPAYRRQLEAEEEELEDRRRSFESDPKRHYCERYATKRGETHFSLSYSQFMLSVDDA